MRLYNELRDDRDTLKITVITAVYNRVGTIQQCLESVLGQRDCDVQYIVVDGMSDDGTEQVIDRYRDRIDTVIREPDAGIYDALNKGIRAATGDVVGFLHADDTFADSQVLSRIARAHAERPVDATYGDLDYVDPERGRVVRHWVSGPFSRRKFFWGWMPPHPTVYLKRAHYQAYGLYNLQMPTAADYELLVRMFVRHRLTAHYIPRVLVNMRVGGSSNASLGNRMKANADDRRAWASNGLTPPPLIRLTKPLRKLPQFVGSQIRRNGSRRIERN